MDIFKVGKYATRLSRLSHQYLNNELKKYSIASSESLYIVNIRELGNPTPEELSTILGFDKGHTTRTLTKLINKGFVIKQVNQEDKRSYFVELTEEGNKLGDSIYEILHRLESIISEGFEEEVLRSMEINLKKMISNVRGSMNE